MGLKTRHKVEVKAKNEARNSRDVIRYVII